MHVLIQNRNAASLTFCVAFSMLCILWQSNPFAQGVGYFGKLADRISGTLNSGLRFTGTLWVELDKYRELEQRYENAQAALEEYRLEKDKFDFLREENDKLRTALRFDPLPAYKEVRAEVLGIRLNSISPRIIIDKGSEDGIEPLMPVLTRAHDPENNLVRCVVGVVAAVDSNTAVIQPLTHPGFKMGVRIADNEEWSILSGNSGRVTRVQLTYLTSDFVTGKASKSQEQEPRQINAPDAGVGLQKEEAEKRAGILREGQIVYSSGAGGIFPPGIPVGTVTEEGPREGEFKTVYVAPLAPISSLDIVSVVLKKPAAWAEEWDREARWEDHLETEFGPPEYPEVTRSRQQKREEPEEKPEPEAAPANTNTAPARTTPATDSGNDSEKAPAQESEDRRPRRIENLNLPGAQ